MNLKLIKNDLKRNPWSNLILFLFMSTSAALAIAVVMMLTQLFSSITDMYKTARPPHFLQMHKGELVQEDIDDFNREYPGMVFWQTVPMVNVSGEEMTVFDGKEKSFTLSECRLDISLVKQNEDYDVLLDENRNRQEMAEGEIGVPVIFLEEYDIAVGDLIFLKSGEKEMKFTVSGFVYDGQMNSTMCSSTRFLLSDDDFETLFESAGEREYLIEAYFEDSSQAAAYQTAYEQSEKNLPKNGQAVTYSMIFLLSAMTDLMMAMIFLITGVLLMAIAMVCLRYAVLAELQEDMREIGTMKAMGIPGKSICSLYLGKIRILMVSGCVTGFILAQIFLPALTSHISGTFGAQKAGMTSLGPALPTGAAVYCVILLFSRIVLGKLKKTEITDLLVTEKGFEKSKKVKDGLRKFSRIPFNLLVGLHEARKGYGIVFGLLLTVSVLIIVPLRMSQTMENKEFITYMGSPVCDLLVEVEQGEELEARKNKAETLLIREVEQGNVDKYSMLRGVRLQAVGEEEIVGIHISTGSEAGSGLKYLSGKNPETPEEIALSFLMAEELGKSSGDVLTLIIGKKRQSFIVSGIYQDVTSGGRTAKALCDFPGEPAEKYSFQVTLKEGTDEEKTVLQWREELGKGFVTENMEEFLRQTLGGVSLQVKQASHVVFMVGIGLTVLITALFLKLRIARKSADLAVKKAMGIPFVAMLLQELYPVFSSGFLGTVTGAVLAEKLGDKVISLLLEVLGMGLKKITFAKMPVWQYLVIPALLLIILTVTAWWMLQRIRKIEAADYFNE